MPVQALLISATTRRPVKKYNLTEFLEVPDEDEAPEEGEEEVKGPNKADLIRTEEDDDLEAVQDPEGDDDLDEDDYGKPPTNSA
jgi:hypothetical protein